MEEEELELISWLKRSEQRKEIVAELSEPRTPTEIADSLDVHLQSVSRNLSRMRERDIVEVVNPEATKGRIYRLTDTAASYSLDE